MGQPLCNKSAKLLNQKTRNQGERLLGRGNVLDAMDVPRPNSDHGPPELQRERDLRQRAVPAADRHHGVGCAHDEAVAELAQAGRDRNLHPPVRGIAILARQDPQCVPPPRTSAAPNVRAHIDGRNVVKVVVVPDKLVNVVVR